MSFSKAFARKFAASFTGKAHATSSFSSSFSTFAKGATAGATTLFMLGATPVALCKPLDTPDYLLPYYLRDSRSRFNHYASIKKKGGRRYMTAEDFVCAILATKDTKLEDKAAADDLRDLFATVDANGDGKLSFGEFSLLMVLLSTSREDWKVAFKMFDVEGKGSVTKEQFAMMMPAFSDEAMKPSLGGGLMARLFGKNQNLRCSFEQLDTLINDLQMEVTKAEFRRFDKKRRGAITSDQFGELIASHMLGSHLPFYIVDNLRKMRSDANLVPFSTYVSFSKIMRNAEDIGEAIQLYTSSGKPLKKPDMKNAVSATGLPPLSDVEVDLVFCLFDRNGDGTLEYDEFLSIMKSKISFHAKGKEKEKVDLFSQLAMCTKEAMGM